MDIIGYEFQEPLSMDDLGQVTRDFPGVYVVLSCDEALQKCEFVDVGLSGIGVVERIKEHEREDCWARQGPYHFALLRVDDPVIRSRIEKEIRERSSPPCGAY